jgi:replicative DNA helicase
MADLLFQKRVIGGILAGYLPADSTSLSPGDLGDLGDIFDTARNIVRQGSSIDIPLIAERLKATDSFYSEQDLQLMAQSVSSASVAYDALEHVKAGALKTFLLSKAAEIALEAQSPASEILEKLKRVVEHAEGEYRSVANDFVPISELAEQVAILLGDLKDNRGSAVSTGFDLIDENLTDGFSKGDAHVIAGMTGSGKTALALNFALRQAKQGQKVGIISREMSSSENIIRLLCSDTETERWKIKRGMYQSTHDDLISHLDGLKKLPIVINTATTTVENLRPQVRREVSKGLSVLYVDYLQLLMSDAPQSTRANEVQTISRTLKLIAMENNIPVVSLCQFNRGAATAGVFDILGHLKESSAIEQDASTVVYIQLEKSVSGTASRRAELIVLKNRNGATFRPIRLRYDGPTFTFSQAESGEKLFA